MTGKGAIEARQYRIISLLGRGGFGTVYRARLEGADGFRKDVAIKLLSDPDPPEDVLKRFRDEARILGLVRDRNIVAVDPPTQLDGHWAVVMEFVDGASCEVLLHRGALPPSVALQIIEEVAGTLDNLFTFQGPGGQPLHLLHRDLKPGNLQLTHTGHVKLLDFGIARATFESRESRTTSHIGGTVGYIAPERLEGLEGPAGDVFSLGVVLHEFVTRRRPTKAARIRPEDRPPWLDPALEPILQLALEMRAAEPEARPTARQVEQRCRALRKRYGGPVLRDWSRGSVPRSAPSAPDERVGTLLTETLAGIPRMPNTLPEAGGARRSPVVGLLLGVIAVLVTALAAVLIGGAGASYWWVTTAASPAPSVARPERVRVPEPQDEPTPAPLRQRPPVAAPRVTEPIPTRPPPPPTPRAAPTPPRARGVVQVTGDATAVRLTGAQGQFAPGPVPAGRYDIQAVFDGREVPAGTIDVPPDETVTLKCVGGFQRCQQR